MPKLNQEALRIIDKLVEDGISPVLTDEDLQRAMNEKVYVRTWFDKETGMVRREIVDPSETKKPDSTT